MEDDSRIGSNLDEEEKERIENIVNNLDRNVKMPPYDNKSERGYSREYLQYKEEEKAKLEYTGYERLCIKMSGYLQLKADEKTRKKLSEPLNLLGWDVTPGMVLSAAVGVGFGSLFLWFLAFIINSFVLGGLLPSSILMISVSIPIAAGFYTYYKPIYAAKNKVIKSSGEMILSILYMVIYMRSSPNLEGAIRFAALNLEGPISNDLKGVLWNLEVGNFNRIEDSLQDYTEAWKGYNDDYLQSLQLLKAAVNEPNVERRESLLQDAIDRMLDGTREKMKHYAQSLKTPVMILNAMGAMLPVLGMIMLPLISVFMGGAISEIHLFLMFNLLLPGFLYWFMQRVLSSRPPSVSSQPVSEDQLPKRGYYTTELLGREIEIPTWPIGAAIAFIVGIYGIAGYLIFPQIYPVATGSEGMPVSQIPSLFRASDGAAPFPMLMRSLSIVAGVGLGIGVSKILGNISRKKRKQELKKIEEQFPSALFQLGNKISGGTPVEVALEEASESTSDLEISGLFGYASRNIRDMGMTFEQALFDPQYGAVKRYPSQMIETVMKAILESSEKGTKMASMAMMTISRYLENIHKTHENLNDLLEETTTTIQMLAYLLAPVVSGVAVGMSQTIITAMYKLGQSFSNSQSDLPSGGATGSSPQFQGVLGNLDSAIPPEVLQFVVGIYLIQLLYILGTFYMKIHHGEDKTYRDLFVGKILISGILFYSITLMLIAVMFGGIVGNVAQ